MLSATPTHLSDYSLQKNKSVCFFAANRRRSSRPMLCNENKQRVERDSRNNHNQRCGAECFDDCSQLRPGHIPALPRGIADRPPYDVSRASVVALIWRLGCGQTDLVLIRPRRTSCFGAMYR